MMSKHGFVAPERRPVETIDELRKIWEGEREWQSRRQFLERHWGREDMPPFELDSLSSVWMNNLVLGCRYPKATIERVKELADGLKVENLVELRGVPKKFVKGAKAEDADSDEDGNQSTSSSFPPKTPEPPKSIVGMNPFKKRKLESASNCNATPTPEDGKGHEEGSLYSKAFTEN
ncbi:uncharacterized protein LOC142334755 [Convolutriloba macropyga]|uniref:uncharacterized protein LOC142334755 n=1 Tax=Convolutriloba macropyga TaxID=536237 RepID=UPI003F523B25